MNRQESEVINAVADQSRAVTASRAGDLDLPGYSVGWEACRVAVFDTLITVLSMTSKDQRDWLYSRYGGNRAKPTRGRKGGGSRTGST